jgi:APA family basic amino acid/polyamine antiporter
MRGTRPGGAPNFLDAAVRRLPIELSGDTSGLRRVLGLWQLTAIGLGAIIGVGIFVLTGLVAATIAGPAVVVSFLIAGAASGAAALCYAEFAGMIPRAGSAYTYAYATLGELAGWIIGWDLLLEYALIVSVVAIGWSGYVRSLLDAAGLALPAWAGAVRPGHVGGSVDVVAGLVALAVSLLLTLRMEVGARANGVIVAVKLAAVLAVIAIGAGHVDPRRWHPFMPFGAGGVLAGASVVFFAVFGYDALTTAAEEARDPARDLPRAVLLSLAIAMVLYVAMCLVLTGIVPYGQLDTPAPVASAFRSIGLPVATMLVSVGAVAGITSVLFACMLAGARIWYALSRDGLLPGWFAVTHPRHGTPHRPTLILGGLTSAAAALFPIRSIAELVNIGSLSAFVVICVSVVVLRRRSPSMARSFRVPLLPVVAFIGAGGSLVLIAGLPVVTDLRFVAWLLVGLGIYAGFGRRHSALARRAVSH